MAERDSTAYWARRWSSMIMPAPPAPPPARTAAAKKGAAAYSDPEILAISDKTTFNALDGTTPRSNTETILVDQRRRKDWITVFFKFFARK
jgi:hypothetical protein